MPEETLAFIRGGDNDSFKLGINYDQNIDPDKPAFWHFIIALFSFLIWMVFLTNYLSRIVGPVTAFFLTKLLRLTKTPGDISIGSLSVAFLAGKVMFRNVVYVCEDFTVKINDGWVIFSFWRFVPDRKINFKKQNTSSRFHLSLNGLQLHCHNRLGRYREIARIFRLERLLGEERVADTKKLNAEINQKAEEHWDRVWALLGVIRIDISSGRLVAGNKMLPYMFVLSFENMESKISLKQSAADRALLHIESVAENVRASFLKHPQYEAIKPVPDPPRTMGDGFAMLQTAKLEFFYDQDILGFKTEAQQTLNERRPVWESVWRFGHNTVISYGPWAEAQRCLLYSFFFPVDYQTVPVTELPKRGQRRVHIMHDVRINLLHETSIDLWFLRNEQLESVHTRCRPGSSMEISVWWIIREEGFSWSANASLLNVETTSSLVFRRFLQCETFSLKCDMHYPREFNAKQTWKVKMVTSKPTLWLVWDHKRFFQDLINDWVGDAPADLTNFVPYTVAVDIEVRDSFEIVLSLSEANWADTTGGHLPESAEAAIVGEKLTLDFLLPFDDFLPDMTKVKYTMNADNNLALRMRTPSQSTRSPILSALFQSSNPHKFAAPSTHGNVSKDSSWFEMWRTEKINMSFLHASHPIAGTFSSDLPYHVLEEFVPRKVDHPRHLTPDTLDCQIEIDGSEVILTGMVVKFLLSLKDNYFGLYDQLTDVATAKAEPEVPGLFGKTNGLLESYRPIDIKITIRVHNMRAHALTHSPCVRDDGKKGIDICPIVFSEQLVVEMQKSQKETMIQVALGACVAYFSKGTTCDHDGFIDLSGLQFRGHAMFSHVDVPWDMACLEYAWLMEILVGDIQARMSPAQVLQLIQFLDSFIVVAVAVDEEMRIPDRFNVCQHGMHPNRCRLKESDRNCPSEEQLKYRGLRVGVSTVNVMIVENRSAVQLSVDTVRLGLCNIHDGKYRDHLTLMIPQVLVRQLVATEQHDNWIEAGHLKLASTNLVIQLPISPDSVSYREADRKKFILKHDAESKRMYFLYDKKNTGCACYGKMRFFGKEDKIGAIILRNMEYRHLTTHEITVGEEQPGFMQSIVREGEHIFTTKPKAAYYPRHTRIEIDRRKMSTDTSDFKSEHGSTPSFHSAVSNNRVPANSVLGRPISDSMELMRAYTTYLHHFQCKPPKLEMPQLGDVGALLEWRKERKIDVTRDYQGVNDLQLQFVTHDTSAEAAETQDKEYTLEDSSDEERSKALGVKGVLAEECEIVTTPLCLEGIDRLLSGFSRCVRTLHPAYLAQSLYRKCATTAHKQPLTANLFDIRPGGGAPVIVYCEVPPIHILLFTCGVCDRGAVGGVAGADLSAQEVSADALFVHFAKSKVRTTATRTAKYPALRFTFRRNGDMAAQLLHFVDKSRPDFAAPRVTLHSAVNWSSHPLSTLLSHIDLRPVVDIYSPECVVVVDLPGGASKEDMEEKKFNVRFGSFETTFVMAKPLEMTSRHEFPVYDVLAPSLSAWLYVVDRVQESATQLEQSTIIYEDMKIMELLAAALESPDDRVLKIGKSCMSPVKKQSKHLASCPSCTLVLALMRYCAFCGDENPSIFYLKNYHTMKNAKDILDKKDRKTAITALLSHWQTVICKHIKLASNEEAAKYREQGVDDTALRGMEDDGKKRKKRDPSPDLNKRPSTEMRNGDGTGEGENTKMDLYTYVLRAHREMKERREGKRVDVGVSKEDVNPMEISLLAFFYTFHRNCKLDWSFIDELPLGLLHLKGEVVLGGMKVDVVEQKFVSSSDLKKYISHSTHSLLQLKKLSASGRVNYVMQMDERGLRPRSIKIDGDYTCDMENVRCVVAISSVCLVKELSLVAMACAETGNELKRLRMVDKISLGSTAPTGENMSAVWIDPSKILPTATPGMSRDPSMVSLCSNDPSNAPVKKQVKEWLPGVMVKMKDFQKSYIRKGLPMLRGNIVIFVKGEVNLSTARLESILTDLCVAVSLQQIGVKHVDTVSDEPGPREVEQISLFLRKAVLTIMETERRGKVEKGEKEKEKDNQHILNCSLQESNATVIRRLSLDGVIDTHVRCSLGAIEGDLPMSAHSLHDVVLRHGAQLEQQFNRLSAPPPLSSLSSSSTHFDHPLRLSDPLRTNEQRLPSIAPRALATRKIVQVMFYFEVASVELNAQLLPSLRAKYRLDNLHSQGVTGEAAKWTAEINKHEVKFAVTAEGRSVPESFTLQLPKVTVNGKYTNGLGNEDDGAPTTAKQLHYREGGYLDVVITLGHVDYNFTTDLLNQILFAEQSFRSELSLLISRLRSSRPIPFAPGPSDSSVSTSKPLLFSLRVEGRGVPWLQLTASTPTSTAVRFTLDNLRATLTNRWVVKEVEGKERIFGAAEIQLSAKLGQLWKPAQFNEVAYELQEYASFMTQIRVENKEGTANSNYSYIIALNRPILLIKSMAFDKAILLWLNYKNTYDYWRAEKGKAERERMEASNNQKRMSIAMFSPPLNTGTASTPEVDVNLSLSIQNGMYICMPLVGTEISDGMGALVISLEKSDVTVCVKKELACQAGFESFKVAFVDNYDEQSLSDTFFKTTGDSNYFYFPQGTYQFCSQASAATGDAEWVLSIRSQMQGMRIDLDQRIGKLTKMLVNTFSSLGDDDDEWTEDVHGGSCYSESDFGEDEGVIDEKGELKKIVQPEGKVRWLERKLHEQSVLVSDLVQRKGKEEKVEAERRKLRQLEVVRFKQFRRSMMDKWKRKREGGGGIMKKPITSPLNDPSKPVIDPFHLPPEPSESTVDVSPHISTSAQFPSGTTVNKLQDTVNMHIDVQINIESGSCILRTQPPKDAPISLAPGMAKRPSAKDLRKGFSLQAPPPQLTTKFSIPSVDIKGYYVSVDKPGLPPDKVPSAVQFRSMSSSSKSFSFSPDDSHPKAVGVMSGQRLRRLPSAQSSARMANSGKENPPKRGCFYLNVALASMPTETLVTPHLADFLEQVLEPLPPSSMFRSASTNTIAESVNTEDNGTVPIVAIDTSVLPLDVILYLTVQSSTIRFEGQQQRSSAADCLLKLPCLTLMASTRRMEGAEYLGGVDISATLSAFSLSIYSPHQQSTAHDALSLTLDHLSFVISRSKNSSQDSDNKVRFVLTANVGSASFNYDMRRLSELMAFPKPWYRAAIMRRVFFGDQSVKPRTPTMNSRPSSRMTPLPNRPRDGEKAWSATVLVAVQWKELNVFAQMSNTMGNTTWKARNGVLRGFTKLNSHLERDASVLFRLDSSELNAHGGAISGQIAIVKLRLSATHYKKLAEPPRNTCKAQLQSISTRMEWMSRPVLVACCHAPSLSFIDEWTVTKDGMGEVIRASVSLSVEGRWDDLQMVITKVTVDDMVKIANKLTLFFQEQLRSSKMVWGVWEEKSTPGSTQLETPKEGEPELASRMWEKVLDKITFIQTHLGLLPLPWTDQGETVVGGSVQFEAGSISLACMHGEMNATSWALFHMRQPLILFTPEAMFSYIDEASSEVGISMKQKLILRLGPDTPTSDTSDNLATVCRVQQSRSVVMRQNATIDACLEYVIGDILKQMHSQNLPTGGGGKKEGARAHSVLELFQFPALEAVLTTYQLNPCRENLQAEMDRFTPEVRSSFVCDFHNAVYVQTDFNAQVSFLPELLKSYMKDQDDLPAPPPPPSSSISSPGVKKDLRVYKCEQWEVDPKIRFIDRFKWNPPVIDDVLKKLQIFDHRTTIPKALQRGVLDPLDVFLAVSLKELLDIASKG